MIEGLQKLNQRINRFLMIVGGVAVLAQMLLASGNVVFRIFKSPWSGSYEIMGFLGALVIAFALGHTQARKDHIAVDILANQFPPALNRVLSILRDLLLLIFSLIVAWEVAVCGFTTWKSGELSETLKIPFHIFIFCVSAGFAVHSLSLLLDFLTLLQENEAAS